MLFNISNHPCHAEKTTWSEAQVEEAERLFGRIIDIGFQACTPDMTDDQIRAIAREVARDISCQLGLSRFLKGRGAMVAGHYIMSTYIVCELQAIGIPCYVGDSIRVAEEAVQPDGSIAIVHKFQFAGFRKYPEICLK